MLARADSVRTRPAAPVFRPWLEWPKVSVLLLALWVGAIHAESLAGKVIHVADGDTITILAGEVAHRVRLSGIDAPEKGQPFGEVSRRSLAGMVAGRQVVVEFHKSDRYGRKVGVVIVDSHDVGLLQIERGMAWHYKRYESEQSEEDRLRYAAAEDYAREAKLGLWRDPQPIPPWESRKK